MIGNTHSDMKETFSHWRARRHLAWSHPPFSSEDLLVVVPLNLLIIIFPITLSFRQQRTTTQRRDETGTERQRRKSLIYIPLRNWDCISLFRATDYCVWQQKKVKKKIKNGSEKEWAGSWAIKAPLCVWRQANTGDCLPFQTW